MKRLLLICLAVLLGVLCVGCAKEEITPTKYKRIAKEVEAHEELIQKCIEEVLKYQDNKTWYIYVNKSVIKKENDNREIELQNKNETLILIFDEIKGLNGITVDGDRIEFAGWGLMFSTIGFCYCPDDDLTIEELMGVNSAGTITVIDDDTYTWKEQKGDNKVYVKRIKPQYFYLEMWW